METTIRLLERARQGDQEALNDLYARYWERLLTVVRLRLGSALRRKLESADVVQEAFLASLRGLDRFEPRSPGDFFHWLCKLVENRIRDQADYFRAARRDILRDVALRGMPASRSTVFGPLREISASATPSADAVRSEELEMLEQAVDELSQDQREAVILNRYEGLSFVEAGEMIGKSPDAVRMLVSRALVALAKKLKHVL